MKINGDYKPISHQVHIKTLVAKAYNTLAKADASDYIVKELSKNLWICLLVR